MNKYVQYHHIHYQFLYSQWDLNSFQHIIKFDIWNIGKNSYHPCMEYVLVVCCFYEGN